MNQLDENQMEVYKQSNGRWVARAYYLHSPIKDTTKSLTVGGHNREDAIERLRLYQVWFRQDKSNLKVLNSEQKESEANS